MENKFYDFFFFILSAQTKTRKSSRFCAKKKWSSHFVWMMMMMMVVVCVSRTWNRNYIFCRVLCRLEKKIRESLFHDYLFLFRQMLKYTISLCNPTKGNQWNSFVEKSAFLPPWNSIISSSSKRKQQNEREWVASVGKFPLRFNVKFSLS